MLVLLCRQLTTYRCNSESNPAHTLVSHLGLVCSHSNTPPSLLQVSPHYCIVQGPCGFSCTLNPFLLASQPSLLSKFLFSNKTQLSLARASFSTEARHHAFPSANAFLNLIFSVKREVQEFIRTLRGINACLLEASPYSFRSTLITTEVCCHEARNSNKKHSFCLVLFVSVPFTFFWS